MMRKNARHKMPLIISKKRKADFFSGLELYMSEYKRKFLSVPQQKTTPEVKSF